LYCDLEDFINFNKEFIGEEEEETGEKLPLKLSFQPNRRLIFSVWTIKHLSHKIQKPISNTSSF
jgi:hypothetical protein